MKSLIALLFCLGAAACSVAGASSPSRARPVAAGSATAVQDDEGDCMPELYAYTSVVSLAKQLGPDSDVFADALSDLREQLVDCLTAPPADLTPVAHRGASGPVGSDRRRL